MKRVALTFIGKDRPGIIARITGSLYDHRGNIEDTTMTILEGQFAMILIATIPVTAESGLKKAFDGLHRQWGLTHFWRVLGGGVVRGEKHPLGARTYLLSVAGRDRTGIVYQTSCVLAKAGLNITDLNSKILGQGKRAIFAMLLEVDIPKNFNLGRLEASLKQLKRRMVLDVTLKPVERLSL